MGRVLIRHHSGQTAEGYVWLGVALAAPCVLLPWLTLGLPEGLATPWVLLNVWVGIVGFWGNYAGWARGMLRGQRRLTPGRAGTHYFYRVLHVKYTLPVDGWMINDGAGCGWAPGAAVASGLTPLPSPVPLVMYLLTHPYFCSYHIGMTLLYRRLGFANFSRPRKVRFRRYPWLTALFADRNFILGHHGCCPVVHHCHYGDVDHIRVPALLLSFAAHHAGGRERLLLFVFHCDLSPISVLLGPAQPPPSLRHRRERAGFVHAYLFRV